MSLHLSAVMLCIRKNRKLKNQGFSQRIVCFVVKAKEFLIEFYKFYFIRFIDLGIDMVLSFREKK